MYYHWFNTYLGYIVLCMCHGTPLQLVEACNHPRIKECSIALVSSKFKNSFLTEMYTAALLFPGVIRKSSCIYYWLMCRSLSCDLCTGMH